MFSVPRFIAFQCSSLPVSIKNLHLKLKLSDQVSYTTLLKISRNTTVSKFCKIMEGRNPKNRVEKFTPVPRKGLPTVQYRRQLCGSLLNSNIMPLWKYLLPFNVARYP